MTEQQSVTYDYCKEYLKCLVQYKEKLPFGVQKFGCGTGVPSIEYQLEDIHRKMFEDVINTINRSISDVKQIVAKI